jgi:YVTN family beta-propeller protein
MLRIGRHHLGCGAPGAEECLVAFSGFAAQRSEVEMALRQHFCIELAGITKAMALVGLMFGVMSSPLCAQVVTATVPLLPAVSSNALVVVPLAVNTATNKIYASNGTDTVTVIDGATNSTTAIPVGAPVEVLAVNPVTNMVYVGEQSNVVVIDGATNSTTTLGVPGAVALAVNTTTNQIYAVSGAAITVIDGATNSTTSIPDPSGPVAVAVNEATNQIYVANVSESCGSLPNSCVYTVTVIDGASNNTSTVTVQDPAVAVAVNAVTNQIYVVNSSNPGFVTVIVGATNNTTTIPVGKGPNAVAINATTNTIYVTNSIDGTVTVINGSTNATTATVTIGNAIPSGFNGASLLGLAVNATANKIYAFCDYCLNGTYPVTFIDGATNNTTSVSADNDVTSIAVNSVTNMAYVGETSTGVQVQVINGAVNYTTSTSLTTSVNPSTLNSSVTFTATVVENAPGTGIPTGTVTFMDGTTTLGTGMLNGSGVTTYTTSSLAVGQHSITAVYGGDTNNAGSTSAVVTQTVNAPDFALSSTPTSMTKAAGQSGTFTVTVTPQGSFTSPISFSCSGLPALAGCGFSPAAVTPNSNTVTTTLTITTAAPTASVAFPPFGHRASPLYAIWLVLPAMLLGTVGLATPKRRKLLSYGLVCLLAGSCLLQVACSGASSNGGGGGGGSTGTPAGSYTITVTGAAGSTQHTATVTLTVQ